MAVETRGVEPDTRGKGGLTAPLDASEEKVRKEVQR